MPVETRLKFYPDYIVKYKKFTPESCWSQGISQNKLQKYADKLDRNTQPKKRRSPVFTSPSKTSLKKFKKITRSFSFMMEGLRKNTLFITLTLPAKQCHSTNQLQTQALKPFLNILRNVHDVKTYVARLEFQKNGNAHWHIIIDKYIHWGHIRRAWNGVLLKLGYIQKYQNKFINMSESDYMILRKPRGREQHAKAKKAYEYGKKTFFSNPNTVDVERIKSHKQLDKYVTKYVNKNNIPDKTVIRKIRKREEKQFRHWSCSYNLSKLQHLDTSFETYVASEYWDNAVKKFKHVITSDYFSILFIRRKGSPPLTVYDQDLLQHYCRQQQF